MLAKRLLGISTLTLFLIIVVPTVYATCNLEWNSCSAGNEILSLNDRTNSHLAPAGDATYKWKVCCDQTNIAVSGGSTLLYLTANGNAHAKTAGSTGPSTVEINVTMGVEYRDNVLCAPGECVVRLWDQTNSHAANCTDTSYNISVCSGPSIGGTTVEMVCGNVTVDGHRIDPACDQSSPRPSKICNPYGTGMCVFEDTGNALSCNSSGTVITKEDGYKIQCNDGGWCPAGYAYDALSGDCIINVNHCDMGWDLGTSQNPKVGCDGISLIIANEELCLFDFKLPFPEPEDLPFNESCCLFPDEPGPIGPVGFTWYNNSENFSFYSPMPIRVY